MVVFKEDCVCSGICKCLLCENNDRLKKIL